MSHPVSYEHDGQLARITIDDGKVNALSPAVLGEVHRALDRATEDDAVVLLKGREGFFSAGFDLGVFAAGGDEVLEMLRLGATLSERMLAHPRPVLLACSGHAVAAGSFLVLAADVRIGIDGPFKIGLNEVAIGLTMPWFAIELARQRLHPAHFNGALVTARMYSPREAVEAGFLDLVVAPEELDAVAQERALALAGLDPVAHAATKLRVREGTMRALREAIESELTLEVLAPDRA